MLRVRILLAVCGLLASTAAALQAQTSPEATLDEAAAATSLVKAGLKPWHLRLAITLQDASGKAAGDAYIEEWWAAPDTWRITYTLPDNRTYTELHLGDTAYSTRAAAQPPDDYEALLDQVVQPLQGADRGSRRIGTRPLKVGQVNLQCILLVASKLPLPGIPIGLVPTYCFDPGSSTLRLQYDAAGRSAIRNKIGTFQGMHVATSVVLAGADKSRVTATLTTLASMPQTAMPLTVTDDLEEVAANPSLISGNVIAGSILQKTQPGYPETAKADHIQGDVVLRAIIGRDGSVRSLEVMSAPRADLAASALIAVRSWRYKPYLVNGVPTDVDTTVTVKYTSGPG